MTDLTPRNFFPYPSEREQPFWDSFKAGILAEDAAIFANADNGNLTFMGGGLFSWDAANDLLFWTEDIYVSGYHTSFSAVIPAASVNIQENEVVFFQMPRLLQQNASVQLWRSSQIFAEGIRLHDLRLFVSRIGDVLYFMNGLSLKDGDTGTLFGAGLIPRQTVLPHDHEAPWVYTAPSAGILTITPIPVIVLPELWHVNVYRNGALQVDGDDYTIDLNTGIITLTLPTSVIPNPDRFVVFRDTRDTTVTVTSHEHPPALVLKPTPGTAVINVLATAPFLLRVDVFRNGALLIAGATDDYTVDLSTGMVTLALASVFGDKFEIHRYLAIAP